MISIDKTSFVEYIEAVIKHYPLEINGILVESRDCFLVKGISYLSQEEIDIINREYDNDFVFGLTYDISKKQCIGTTIPIENTRKNLRELIENKKIVRGILHGHTWQERAPESCLYLGTLINRLVYSLKKPPMKKPELSGNDIKKFDEIIKSYSKQPIYYGILNVPNPLDVRVILRELDKRLLFFEEGKVLTGYTIKE